MRRCPVCKQGELEPTEHELRRELGGHVFTARVPAQRCRACGEGVVEGRSIERFELKIAKALVGAPPTGESVRFVQKAVGLKAVDLAELLGVAPETVSRWEAGRHPVDRSVHALLSLLLEDRLAGTHRTEDALRKAARPEPLDEHVEIKVAS